MAKSGGQKIKLLYLMKILLENTDEAHTLTLPEITGLLEQQGIQAERKGLYDDIETLRSFGVNIECRKTRFYEYYIGEREFQLPELKLLVDAVQSSKFITRKKSLELIKKVESLCSRYDAQLLQRQVYVSNRIKTMNESIYYNVDAIHSAISQNKKISFQYYEWVVDFSKPEHVVKNFRHDGKTYCISPWALMWDDENYYMLGFDTDAGMAKHYRVDKMSGIAVDRQQRDGRELFEKLDIADYSKRLYGMFSGTEESVRLCFHNRLIGVVIDRFGQEITVTKADEDHFFVNLRVISSPQFLAWLYSFADDVRVVFPEHIKQELMQRAQSVQRVYE